MDTRELLEEKVIKNEIVKRIEVSFNNDRLFVSVRTSSNRLVVEKNFPNDSGGKKQAKEFLKSFKKKADLEKYFEHREKTK